MTTPALALNNDVAMPALIDTAAAYGNEREVGEAIHASGLEDFGREIPEA